MSTATSPTHAPAPRAFVLGNFVLACCWQVARLPRAGETFEAHGFHSEAGGKGLNVAVALQRLGVKVDTLIGAGSDAAADRLFALLAHERLSTRHVHRLPGPSGWGAGMIGADGANAIAVYPGANHLLTAAHAQAARAEIESAQLVYGQFETSIAAVEAAFTLAHGAGVPTLLNPAPWRPPTPALKRCTRTVLVNEIEAADLLGLDVLPVAAASTAVGAALEAFSHEWPAAQRLVVTLGAGGALGAERDAQGRWQSVHSPACAITAVDTVGAGDAFAAGYAAAVLAGQPLAEALRWGNRCGGEVAARAGVLAALPDAARLRELLQAAPAASGA